MKSVMLKLVWIARLMVETLQLPALLLLALLSRLAHRPIDVGLGPLPIINNVYHKRALQQQGYSAETFVDSIYFITQEFDRKFIARTRVGRILIKGVHLSFLAALFRYRCLYLYFNGGPLGATVLLWRFEPLLLRIADIRSVLMPYGIDVQVLTRAPNLMFRHAMGRDYPFYRFVQRNTAAKIDLWTWRANHVISGCDWVDYMYFWHTLMLAHFSIDTKRWSPVPAIVPSQQSRPFRVLHAPNHKAIKGSQFFIKAVEDLRAEGRDIELVLVQKRSNDEIRALMCEVDVVADQLIIGWYAMFAIEAMAMAKPVLCYLREDLKRLYIDAGLVEEGEIPLIQCTPASVKDTLRRLMDDHEALAEAGRRGPAYVQRHHSTESVGMVFAAINRSIGLMPRGGASGAAAT
jgi:glycosyltransferase involved in cell wall biosynthesis